MPRPIFMTPEMIEESFKEVREDFEKQFAEAKESAGKKKLASGNFKFKMFERQYFWKDDDSRATLVFTPEAFSKTMLTVLTTDKEVGWHGLIHRDEEDSSKFILDDILLYPQSVTGATIDADQAKYPIWAMKLPDEKFNAMRFHGHSHVNMATNPSGVDMNFREDLIAQFKDGFYVFLIINKRLETTAQIYDFDNNTLYETNDIDILVTEADFGTEIAEANKAMVETKTYSSTPKYSGYWSSTAIPPKTTKPAPTTAPGWNAEDFFDDDYWRGVFGQ